MRCAVSLTKMPSTLHGAANDNSRTVFICFSFSSQKWMKRPHPQAGGRVRMGPLGSRAEIEFSLFTLRWWEKVLVFCFSQITLRLILLSRTDPVPRSCSISPKICSLRPTTAFSAWQRRTNVWRISKSRTGQSAKNSVECNQARGRSAGRDEGTAFGSNKGTDEG